MDATHPLDHVAKFIQREASQQKVAAIFDIDSTLFCVSPRNQAILRNLAATEEFQRDYPEAARALEQVTVNPSDWGVKATLERLQMQVDEKLIDTIRKHWRENFFSNHYLHHDEMYPSASDYVRQLHSLGATILYLTGRWQKRMRSGTLDALRKWNFPLENEENLIMKPNEEQADEGFKVTVLKRLLPWYDHIWFFENEPVIIDLVRKELPQVQVVFVDTVHSGRNEAPKDLMTIKGNYQWPFT
jgi:hypothetical protein